MGRQHFAVRIDVDALAFALLQDHLQVLQVMAGDQDGLALLHAERHFCRDRMAVGAGVAGIEDFHGPEIDLSALEHQADPLVQAQIGARHGG